MKKNMRNDYNGGKKLSMKQSILWNSWGSMFYLGCQWLLTILVVRISGVDNAGLLSLAMSVSNIWYSLAVYGMRNFQVSDTNENIQTVYIFQAEFLQEVLLCLDA